jgi:hypothetical protein
MLEEEPHFQQLRQHIFTLVEQVRTTLPPDGDFQPMLLLFDGEQRLIPLPAPQLTDSGREKLLDELPTLLRDHDAQALALIATVVSHHYRPGENPDRGPAEQVQAQFVIGGKHQVWYSAIVRQPGSAPQLGEWEQRPGALEPGTWVAQFAKVATDFLGERAQANARQAVKNYGVSFTGEPWIIMVDLLEPLPEVAFTAAVDPQIVRDSRDMPVGIDATLIGTPYGHVLRFTFELYDDPVNPLRLVLPVNPAPDAGGEMIRRLAQQETTQILFLDPSSGEDITRRVLPVAPAFRRDLTTMADEAAKKPSSLALWRQAVAAADPYLG